MTTAAKTGFALDRLETNGYTFYFDGNQKTTGNNGTFEEPAANSFSLVQVQDCPWSTPTCQASCYVHNLEEFQKKVHDCYKHNSKEIRRFFAEQKDEFWGETYQYDYVITAFATWINTNAAGGFRWHVSGDIFSLEYANFIKRVCEESLDVNHWIYTRSFHYIDPLLEAQNLVVNLSADQDNYWLARRVADQHGLRVCYLDAEGDAVYLSDLKPGDVIFPDYGLRGIDQKPHAFREGSEWWNSLPGTHKKMVCPVDIYGKSDKVRCGPCSRCLE